jgi:hypothetical protein
LRRVTRGLRPLTERILTTLPGPRWVWVTAWALVPWFNAGANLLLDTGARSAVWEQSHTLVLLNYAALSFAVVLTLWGTERIARSLEDLGATTSRVLETDSGGHFRELNSVAAPVVASAATAIATKAPAHRRLLAAEVCTGVCILLQESRFRTLVAVGDRQASRVADGGGILLRT